MSKYLNLLVQCMTLGPSLLPTFYDLGVSEFSVQCFSLLLLLNHKYLKFLMNPNQTNTPSFWVFTAKTFFSLVE